MGGQGSPLAVLGSNEMEMRGVIRSISYQLQLPWVPLCIKHPDRCWPELINDSSQPTDCSALTSPDPPPRYQDWLHSISPSRAVYQAGPSLTWQYIAENTQSGLRPPQDVSNFKVIIVQCLTVKFSPQIFVFCQIFHLLFAQIHIWSFLNLLYNIEQCPSNS